MKVLKRKHWKVRWEGEEKWHVTVAFVGEVQKDKILRRSISSHTAGHAQSLQDLRDDKVVLKSLATLLSVVDEVCGKHKQFELGLKGLGSFPDLLLPKIVWVSLKGDLMSLHRLAREIRLELEKAGIDFQGSKFLPHVTFGRVKPEARRKERLEMGKEIGKMIKMEIPQRWVVDRVVVYESVLKPGGSEYKVLREIELKV